MITVKITVTTNDFFRILRDSCHAILERRLCEYWWIFAVVKMQVRAKIWKKFSESKKKIGKRKILYHLEQVDKINIIEAVEAINSKTTPAHVLSRTSDTHVIVSAFFFTNLSRVLFSMRYCTSSNGRSNKLSDVSLRL